MSEAKNVTIDKIEKKSAKNGKDYWKVQFKEPVEGKKIATLWEKDVAQIIHDNDLVDIEYAIQGEYMNLTSVKVTLSGRSVSEKIDKPINNKELETVYKECYEFISKLYPTGTDITSSVNTLFITRCKR